MSKKKKSKKKHFTYKDYSDREVIRVEGIPNYLTDTSCRKKVQFGYVSSKYNEMLLTKLCFNNVDFVVSSATDKLLTVNLPLTPDHDTKMLEVIPMIVMCNEITPCFKVDTFKGGKHMLNFYMTLKVVDFSITEQFVKMLIQF